MTTHIAPDFTGPNVMYAAHQDGACIGHYPTYADADAAFSQPPYEALSMTAPGDDPDDENPSEEGGEGGPGPGSPYDEALAWERLHAACIAAAHPIGGPARCDVGNCAAIGTARTVGGVRAYVVTLCGPHAAELSTAVGVAS